MPPQRQADSAPLVDSGWRGQNPYRSPMLTERTRANHWLLLTTALLLLIVFGSLTAWWFLGVPPAQHVDAISGPT